MQREKMFEILQEAEFERVVQCCPGVSFKICSGDQWKGNMDALFARIEKEFKPELTDEEKFLQETFPEEAIEGQIHKGKYADYVYINYENELKWLMVMQKPVSERPSMGERADALNLYRRIRDFVNGEARGVGATEHYDALASRIIQYGSSLRDLSMYCLKNKFGHNIRFDSSLRLFITLFEGPKLEQVEFASATPRDNFATIKAVYDYIERKTNDESAKTV